MSLGSIHYNYLFIGKKHIDLTLLNDSIFPQIIEAINPLLAFTNVKKCKIAADQYVNQSKIKLGRPRWDMESLMPICQNYKQYPDSGSFHFGFLSAEFPSIESAYKRQDTVDIYLYIENDLFWGKLKSDGDCGLFLSLREDIFELAGEALIRQVLQNIYKIFDSGKVLFHKRVWWSKSKKEESALQDVMPFRAVDKLYKSNYEKWSELDCKTYLLSEKSGT